MSMDKSKIQKLESCEQTGISVGPAEGKRQQLEFSQNEEVRSEEAGEAMKIVS